MNKKFIMVLLGLIAVYLVVLLCSFYFRSKETAQPVAPLERSRVIPSQPAGTVSDGERVEDIPVHEAPEKGPFLN